MKAACSDCSDAGYAGLRDRLRCLFVLLLAMAASILLILWSKEQVRKRNPEGATIGSLRGVVGYPERIDVIASLAGARQRSDIKSLRGIIIDGVRSNGFVDLKANDLTTKYVFMSGPDVGWSRRTTAQPLGKTERSVCPKQGVKLKRRGFKLEEDRPENRCPPALGAPLPRPACGPKEVWQWALKRGAPPDALARMEYYWSKAGPAWRMSLPKKRFSLTLSGDCLRELDAKHAAGKVP